MIHVPNEAAGTQRVLVVDDEETVRNLLSLVVGRAGGKADLAETAGAARELLAGKKYACAIIDKNLPDGSGIDLLATLKEQSPDTEVLIVTGYANMESAIQAIRLGAFDYIVKPFDVSAVTHRIKLALERRHLREELTRALGELRQANAQLSEHRQEVERAYLESAMCLAAAAELENENARAHIQRMSRYAGILAGQLGATADWRERLVQAAPLHDIGMIAVPEAIRTKAGPLTLEEKDVVKGHVAAGARILEGTTSDVLALGREVVLSHHEKWDGSGYPAGTRGDEIPLSGRIVAVCDAWDAMTTDRVYRKALGPDKAAAEIEACAGTHFDPAVAAAFIECRARFEAVLEGK